MLRVLELNPRDRSRRGQRVALTVDPDQVILLAE
jgi:hypothetical protein